MEPYLPFTPRLVVTGLDQAVMMRAQQHKVPQRSRTSLLPRSDMMGITFRNRDHAAGEDTSAITQRQGTPERRSDETPLQTDIEDLGITA